MCCIYLADTCWIGIDIILAQRSVESSDEEQEQRTCDYVGRTGGPHPIAPPPKGRTRPQQPPIFHHHTPSKCLLPPIRSGRWSLARWTTDNGLVPHPQTCRAQAQSANARQTTTFLSALRGSGCLSALSLVICDKIQAYVRSSCIYLSCVTPLRLFASLVLSKLSSR